MKKICCLLALLMPFTLHAESEHNIVDLVKVDDFTVTNLHFAIFNSQNENNPNAQNQPAMLQELISIFMLANSKEGQELANHPEIASSMQLNNARLVAQTLMSERLKRIQVNDNEIQDLYQKRYAGGPGMEYKARHILLKTEKAADAVIAELNGGADFATLAKQKSIGPSKDVGGDLGWFSPKQMVKPFADAVGQLKNGDYSKQAVQTSFGWHVILREDAKKVPVPKLADVKQKIIEAVKHQKLAVFIRDIREKSTIRILGESTD